MKDKDKITRDKDIEASLEFLIKDFLCSYVYKYEMGSYYMYKNERFKVSIYEHPQFDELNIDIIINQENYHIDPAIEEPLEYRKLKQRGLKGFLNYDNKKFWEFIAKILKRKINELLKIKHDYNQT